MFILTLLTFYSSQEILKARDTSVTICINTLSISPPSKPRLHSQRQDTPDVPLTWTVVFRADSDKESVSEVLTAVFL